MSRDKWELFNLMDELVEVESEWFFEQNPHEKILTALLKEGLVVMEKIAGVGKYYIDENDINAIADYLGELI